jgi:hypothetical protein
MIHLLSKFLAHTNITPKTMSEEQQPLEIEVRKWDACPFTIEGVKIN